MEQILRRFSNLLTVKSLVTLALTGVFVYMTVAAGEISRDFMVVYTVVIAFYFGTQTEKSAKRDSEEG